LLLFQFRQLPAEACRVYQNLAGILFEGDEDARLAELARPIDQCANRTEPEALAKGNSTLFAADTLNKLDFVGW